MVIILTRVMQDDENNHPLFLWFLCYWHLIRKIWLKKTGPLKAILQWMKYFFYEINDNTDINVQKIKLVLSKVFFHVLRNYTETVSKLIQPR